MQEVDRNLPVGGEIFLDHVGHFVRDAEPAALALARAGFAPTPPSVQSNPDGTPTGTGNVTAMFSRGYIEVLFKTADTPLGREFDLALSGHPGVHLAAFSVADAEAQHRRLTGAGFAMRQLVQFQRPVATATGPGVAAFTVVRLERGAMAEGRIQMLAHRTEDTVWQPRWLSHPNGALGLVDLVVVCADVDEAAGRFVRFTGHDAMPTKYGQAIALDRGQIQLFSKQAFAQMFPEIAVPGLPFLGAYALRVSSLGAVEDLLRQSHLPMRRIGAALVVPFPDVLGVGAWLFVENASDLPWRSRRRAAMESGRERTLTETSDGEPKPWQDQLFETLKGADIRQVGCVPDAGHSRLIARCKADPDIRDVVLTTEEEGIAMAAGAWLGGQRSALLMQSSGVGNCVNMLSLIRACRFPMLMLVTMRGEWEEFNPWQVPMGSIVQPTLELCETHVAKVETPDAVVPAVQNALQLAFGDDRAAAVLLSQKLIGRKVWVK